MQTGRPTWRASTLAIALLVAVMTFAARGTAAQADVPTTGIPVDALAAYDQAMLRLMAKWSLPGGALAVVRSGRLVLARGYGYADREAGLPVQPDALFRVASLSKPITSAAVLQLVEQGRLDLDASAFRIVEDLKPADATVDPRLWEITVRQLLHHTGGWDRGKRGDLMFRPRIQEAAQALGAPLPASCETAIGYTFTQPLDFDPGTRYVYSNLGYCVLGRVVERVTGASYVDHVTTSVLQPAGVRRMQLGGSTPAERAAGEVRYYTYPGAPLVEPELPGLPDLVEAPDGGMYLGRFDAHGGWIASPIEYARFVTTLFGQRRPGLLQTATVALLGQRPAPPVTPGSFGISYGLGWDVRAQAAGPHLSHQGGLPGTKSIVTVRPDGTIFVAVFNGRPAPDQDFQIGIDLDQSLNEATSTALLTRSWPEYDLFELYR